jgi:hypothetical protein
LDRGGVGPLNGRAGGRVVAGPGSSAGSGASIPSV